MYPLILASILSCSEGAWILDGLGSSDISQKDRVEIMTEIIGSMPNDCDATDYRIDRSRRKS